MANKAKVMHGPRQFHYLQNHCLCSHSQELLLLHSDLFAV